MAVIPTFSVTPLVHRGCRVLLLEGDLDLAETPKLETAVAACTDGMPVIVDVSALTFIDSGGLHALLTERPVGRPAAIVRIPGSNVARVLDLVEARKMIPLYDDLADAVEHTGPACP